jgi:hypothetical protein
VLVDQAESMSKLVKYLSTKAVRRRLVIDIQVHGRKCLCAVEGLSSDRRPTAVVHIERNSDIGGSLIDELEAEVGIVNPLPRITLDL